MPISIRPLARVVSLAGFVFFFLASLWPAVLRADEVRFDRDIRPILAANCLVCHGPDEGSREADLRLDGAEGAADAIVPGDPNASDLVVRIESRDEDEIMPPPDSGHVLNDAEKALLRRWISEGGEYEKHWAFLKPVRDESRIKPGLHPIDHFVRQRLLTTGLEPNHLADRHQLIRRLTLDLIGLPPTPEQADAFASDSSPDAYEKVIDRLLASDSFGERWARMWLDLARYADTKGYEKDNPREIWRYRDWVIDAFNRDLPFDRFTTEQLAGDLLADATVNHRLATAFHRNTLTNEEGGTDDEEFRIAAVKDRVDTTIQVWMGLTMGCAKCHSHKYDPITQEEYYRFFAFFNQTADSDRESPVMASPTTSQLKREKELQSRLSLLRSQLNESGGEFETAYQKWRTERAQNPTWKPLRLTEFRSQHEIRLTQKEDRRCVVEGQLPAEDTWDVTFTTDDADKLTALRIETFAKQGEGNANDKNHVLNELTIDVVRESDGDSEVVTAKLTNPRSDFSQKNWPVSASIDGDGKTGWAVSPKAAQPHVAIYDFASPIEFASNMTLKLRMRQTYGSQLVLSRFRVSVSSVDPKELKPVVSEDSRKTFQQIYPPTRDWIGQIESAEKDLARVRSGFAKTPVMQELPAGKTRQTRIHRRGNFLDPGELVEADVPTAFGELPPQMPRNRLGVAKWIANADNPLTARVMANRIWARLFGIGIVETEEDFGTQGLRPSHPELLDWLALEYQENGWSLKQLLKTIVLSETYRQSSTVSGKQLDLDPRNRWLSRGPRFRLSAEMIRDQALAASGLMTHKIGGPSVMPPQPDGVWKTTYSARKWINAVGEDRYRRALYTYWKRTSPYPAMTTFDAGSGEVCLVRRVRTNTPLQALITLNDPSYFEAAGALALRMRTKGLEFGFRSLLTRKPTDAEADRLRSLFDEVKADFEDDLAAAASLAESAGLDRATADAELAAWVTLANVLLNLDETVTKP